jgi:hypothetical protein
MEQEGKLMLDKVQLIVVFTTTHQEHLSHMDQVQAHHVSEALTQTFHACLKWNQQKSAGFPRHPASFPEARLRLCSHGLHN